MTFPFVTLINFFVKTPYRNLILTSQNSDLIKTRKWRHLTALSNCSYSKSIIGYSVRREILRSPKYLRMGFRQFCAQICTDKFRKIKEFGLPIQYQCGPTTARCEHLGLRFNLCTISCSVYKSSIFCMYQTRILVV